MTKRVTGLLIILMVLTGFHWWDPFARWIGIGNTAYEKGDFKKAEESFSQAEKVAPGDPRAIQNLGAAEYRQEKMDDAAARFKTAAESASGNIAADAWYDLGCTQLKSGKPDKAIESFTNALRKNPRDLDAKVNLELARKMKSQMQTQTPQPQQQDQQKKQDGEQTPQPSPQPSPQTTPQPTPGESQNKPSPQATTPTPRSESKSESGKPGTPTPSPSQSPAAAGQQATASPGENTPTPRPVEEGQMSPQEAERLLDAAEDEEMEVLKRFHQLPQPEQPIDKDW